MNSDNEIAGDPTAVPHLLPPAPQHPATVAGFAGLAGEIARCRTDWEPLVRYDPVSRWYHRLRTGPGYEIWLLSWLPGQGSGSHGHGRSHGVFTVLEGELTEYARRPTASGASAHAAPTDPGRATPLSPGRTRVFAPGFVHEVVNTSLAPAVSLHLYHPGLTEMPMVPAPAAVRGADRAEGRASGPVPHGC